MTVANAPLSGSDPAPASSPSDRRPVVLFDGECVLCHRSVAFLLDHDRDGALRFAHLQGEFARRTLSEVARDAGRDGSVVVFEPAAHGRVSLRSEAILRALGALPAPWRWLGGLVRVRPLLPILDVAYRFVVQRRTAWFGRYEQCRLPDPRARARFLD